MAAVEKNVERTVVETVTYTLTLDPREALTLYRILGRVSGPLDGPRAHVMSVYRALESAGIPLRDDGTIQAVGSSIRVEGEK